MNLVEEAKLGNEEAFNMLIEENKLKMYKVAKSILKNEDDVCDAIQNALISTYTNLNKLQNNQFFSTWMTRILINKCYDIAKATTILYYYNDYSVNEISQILEVPEGTVKSRLSRARSKIYEIIKSEEDVI